MNSLDKNIGGLTFKYLKNDLPAGLVVFLVALPLCLGIALASGAPLFAGIIAGVVGGTVVAFTSGSSLSVSGPAAGLTVIVHNAITGLGSYEVFLLAVALAGLIQLALGFLKAGIIGYYFPSNVIKGMLAAIGIILILKQIPHAVGYDVDNEGDFDFIQADGENTFTEILNSVNHIHPGAILIAVVSLIILILWDQPFIKKFSFTKVIPGALIAVISGIVMNEWFKVSSPDLVLSGNKLVNLPVADSAAGFIGQFTFPDFSALGNYQLYMVAFTIAIIASLESLLSVEAVDKLDPYKRNTPTNRELKAQGLGNLVSGLIGGLPITAVIVRSSANIGAGAKTKLSAITHGLFLLLSVIGIANMLNKIPLAALAALLLVVGYKLARISLFKSMYKMGWDQFLPFITTVVAIQFSDLLKGIAIGMAVSIFFILRNNYRRAYHYSTDKLQEADQVTIQLAEDVTFLNKGSIVSTLDKLPENSSVMIDGSKSHYIDIDVIEIIHDFKNTAELRKIKLELKGIPEFNGISGH
ncbi:MAG TPA: SulP family inorganic anion transporter [Cyclobacteriaceae bacterium]|nr:SulP family inorganic anion transporter [Cyclobacteriaceae bacterium]